MELACATGSLKLGAGLLLELDLTVVLGLGTIEVLELGANVVLVPVRVNVVNAVKEPTEVTALKGRLKEVL